MRSILIFVLLTFLMTSPMLLMSQEKDQIDSFKRVIHMIENKPHQISLLIDIAAYHAELVEKDSALAYANEALELAKQFNLDSLLAMTLYTKAFIYDYSGDLQQALVFYEEARKAYANLNDQGEVINSMNSKGVAAYYQGNFELALDLYLTTLEYIDSIGNKDKLSNVLNNIGVIYRITNKTDEAIAIYRRALKQYSEANDTAMMQLSYQNIGVAYTYQNNLDSSISNLNRVYNLMTLPDDNKELPSLLNAFAEAYFLCGPDIESARKYVNQAEKLGKKFENQEYLSKIYLLKSEIELYDKNYNIANDALNSGLLIIDSTDREDLKLDYYEQAYKLHDEAGYTDNAVEYMKKYMSLYKKVQATEKMNAIAEAQTKYESIEKEKEITQLKYEEEISSLRLSRHKSFLFFSVASTLALGIILYLVFRQKTKIEEKNTIIFKSLAEKDILLKEIHHRVKNNLQFISSLLGLQTEHVSDKKALGALQEGQDRVQSMALIHQNLYQEDNLTGVDMDHYFKKLVRGLFDSYNIRNDQIALTMDIEDLNLDVDTVIPIGLIVNELISNSLKYAFPEKRKGTIFVGLKEVINQLQLVVKDDGIGIADTQLSNMGTSFGYRLINVFKDQMRATIIVDGSSGTEVIMSIDKYQKAS